MAFKGSLNRLEYLRINSKLKEVGDEREELGAALCIAWKASYGPSGHLRHFNATVRIEDLGTQNTSYTTTLVKSSLNKVQENS